MTTSAVPSVSEKGNAEPTPSGAIANRKTTAAPTSIETAGHPTFKVCC